MGNVQRWAKEEIEWWVSIRKVIQVLKGFGGVTTVKFGRVW